MAQGVGMTSLCRKRAERAESVCDEMHDSLFLGRKEIEQSDLRLRTHLSESFVRCQVHIHNLNSMMGVGGSKVR